MSNFDYLDLDGRLLHLLLAVHEERSVTRAAQRLEVTQSAVSHGLERLRAITGDALFVKSGRGIAATARAADLALQARGLLEQLRGFAGSQVFDPAQWHGTVTVAANDFQREVLLPALAARLRAHAPGVALRVIPSGIPSLEMLRDGACDLALSPRPPVGSDIVQKRLFEDCYRVFYDPAARAAPRTLQDYLAADHITVVYEPRRPLELDRSLAAQGVQRRFAVMLPGFAGMPAFLRGSPLLAAAPGLLGDGLMAGFASLPMPLDCPRLPMYLVWHRRVQQEPAHCWLRAQIEALVSPVLRSPPLS